MLIGREEELNLFKSVIQDDTSHFIAVYGRRRVGKTFLIREAFNCNFTFSHTGIFNADLKQQLFSFCSSLKDCGVTLDKKVNTWIEAFDLLKDAVKHSNERKKVIFIDEISWLDTPKSNFIASLENFWNCFASQRKDVVLIICGSATSWMLSKVVHNKGGLYNRLTEQINLRSFCLKECEEFVKKSGLVLTRNQILQYYMIFGGVPYYWSFLKKGLSLAQNIDKILFAEDAPLKKEFSYLYSSIFKNPDVYIKIIEALATKKTGLTRDEIIEKANIVNSGDLTKKLEELESCSFIRKYRSFGSRTKNAVYQLMDNFTLFYFSFLKQCPTDENYWTNQINTPALNTWLGLSFEKVCLEHIRQIKNKLGISGVLTDVNSWFCRKDADKGVFGSQIDLLIVRKDNVINVCEMKYSWYEYTITEKTHRDIFNKISDFVTVTNTKYALYPTIITTYGLVENSYSGDIQSVVVLDDLFA